MLNRERKSMFSNFLATLIFFSPNFLLLIPAIENSRVGFLIYNFIILFLLVSTISNIQFNIPDGEKSSTVKKLKDSLKSPTLKARFRKI